MNSSSSSTFSLSFVRNHSRYRLISPLFCACVYVKSWFATWKKYFPSMVERRLRSSQSSFQDSTKLDVHRVHTTKKFKNLTKLELLLHFIAFVVNSAVWISVAQQSVDSKKFLPFHPPTLKVTFSTCLLIAYHFISLKSRLDERSKKKKKNP